MEQLHNIILQVGGNLWNIVVALAVFLGVLYGIRTCFVQFRLFPETFRVAADSMRSGKVENGISGFQALFITLGGAIGTGNVAGVAMAIVVGGPGIVPWMWMIALLGAGISFAENTLAQIYKTKEGDIFRGGPAYYMEKALGKRWLGTLYAFIMIVSLGFALVGLQTNTIVVSVGQAFKIPTTLTAGVVAVLIALIIFGGVKRIANVAEKAVPIMTISYILLLFTVIVINISNVPKAFALIFSEAFTTRAVTGATFFTVVTQGIKRGVFSSGAGHGDAPTTSASATVSHPVKQGLFGTLTIYVDTIIVCTATALAIILAEVHVGTGLIGIELSQFAFTSVLGNWSGIIFAICISTFCFTSIMANYFCGETSLTYLTKEMKGRNLYRIIFVIVVFLGGIARVDLMWDIADMFLALMIILNMISLTLLGGKVVTVTNDYIKQRKEGKEPIFNVKNVKGIKNAECWEDTNEFLNQNSNLSGEKV